MTKQRIYFLSSIICAFLIFALSNIDIDMDLKNRFANVSSQHLLGTNHLGQDLLQLTIHGICNSLILAVLIIFSALIASVLILYTRHKYRVFDYLFETINIILIAIPGVIVSILLLMRYNNAVLSVFVTSVLVVLPIINRQINDLITNIIKQPYVASAQVAGLSDIHIFKKYILLNIKTEIISLLIAMIARIILVEGTLSWLGLGYGKSVISIGTLIFQARPYMLTHPILLLAPTITMIIFIVMINYVTKTKDVAVT